MKGTGFCASAVVMAKSTSGQTKRATFMAAPGTQLYDYSQLEHPVQQEVALKLLEEFPIFGQRLFFVQCGQNVSWMEPMTLGLGVAAKTGKFQFHTERWQRVRSCGSMRSARIFTSLMARQECGVKVKLAVRSLTIISSVEAHVDENGSG